MDLSVCIITRNENEKLKRCLKSLAFLEADIVVVDTGFNDETRKIVTELNGRYFTFEWCDDFSAARNYSLEQAYYDDIMVIDSDEWLDEKEITFNKAALESFIRRDLYTLACCYQVNIVPNLAYGEHHAVVPRIFSKKYFHYEGKAHEQPVPLMKNVNSRTITVELKMYHDGYAGAGVVKAKSKRNLALLLQDLKNDEHNIYLLFQVGMSYLNLEQYELALKYFEEEFANRNFNYSYVYAYDVCYGYLKALLTLGQTDLVLAKLTYFAKKFPNLADFWYDAGDFYLKLNQIDSAISAFKRAVKCSQVTLVGKDGDFAYYNLGKIYTYLGDFQQASYYYEQCSADFGPAQTELLALRQRQFSQAVTVYILDTLKDERALLKTLTSLETLPFTKLVLSQKAYPQAILGKSKLVQLEPSALNEYLKQTTNYSLVLYSGESLVDLDLGKLKAVLESKLALSGYGLVFSPNQVKVLGYRSFYHELRLVTGTAHEFQAGLLQATSDTKEVLIPLTIESPIEVRASLDFSKTSSVYATLLFIEGNYANALKYYQAYLKDCDYGLEESLHSVANAILASVFSDQIDWLEPYLETWTQFYQNFAIYQFSLGHYLKKIGKKQAAQQAFREAKRLANSLNPIINEED
ncbi:MAG: glycosyltransferase [Ligilactobacillus agilis]|nr:glycosyltransferase [Ligilactobacillus agilis]